VLAGDEFLEHVSAHPQGPFPEVLAARIEAVEGHEERWGGGVVLPAATQPFEVGDEVAVEDRDLTVEQERGRVKPRHCGGQLRCS